MDYMLLMPIISKLGGLFLLFSEEDLKNEIVKSVDGFWREYLGDRLLDDFILGALYREVNEEVFLGKFYPELDPQLTKETLRLIKDAEEIREVLEPINVSVAYAVSLYNNLFIYPGDFLKVFSAAENKKEIYTALFLTSILLIVNNISNLKTLLKLKPPSTERIKTLKSAILKLL